MSAEARLKELGIVLPKVPAPVANYLPYRIAGNLLFLAGQGCGTCRGTGFKGRKAIAEFLVLDDELREMIVSNAPIRQIKETARRGGTRLLREAERILLDLAQFTNATAPKKGAAL